MNPIWFNDQGLEWSLPKIQPLEVTHWGKMEEAIETF
jgi:hypothetical protein